MRSGIIIFAAVFIGTVFSQSPAFACKCEPRTLPKEREGVIQKSPTCEFSWFSDSDKRTGDQYCYERVVTNKHKKRNLDYEWQIAEMDNMALPPNERDRICKVRGAYRDQPAKGLLTYGRNNLPTDTEVWKAQAEPRTGETKQVASFSPLETMLEFVFEIGPRRFRNSVLLRSFATVFETHGRRVFRYSYVLENLLEEAVIVSWEIPGLPERIKADPLLTSMVRGTETGLAVELRGVVGIPLDHTHPPMFGMFPVYFFEPGGRRIAKGSAEAYIPPR